MTAAAATTLDNLITIVDQGRSVSISYDDVRAFHKGESWFGVAVAFRAMQLAGKALSMADGEWDRSELYVVSGHPGPGVKDAIECITHCVSSDRFRLTDEVAGQSSCGSDMKFNWWVSNGKHTAFIDLVDGFVPDNFLERLDRLSTGKEQANDKKLFGEDKHRLAEQITQDSADDNFRCELIAQPLVVGELPTENFGRSKHA